MSQMLKLSIAALLSLLVAACGFQLRGQANLPPQMARTHITGVAIGDGLGLELATLLRANGVEVVYSPDSASAIVTVSRMNLHRRVLSVDASANVREYELALTVAFHARGQGNDFELAEQTITVTRTLLNEPTNVLGEADEHSALAEDMQRDLARLMFYRFSAAGR